MERFHPGRGGPRPNSGTIDGLRNQPAQFRGGEIVGPGQQLQKVQEVDHRRQAPPIRRETPAAGAVAVGEGIGKSGRAVGLVAQERARSRSACSRRRRTPSRGRRSTAIDPRLTRSAIGRISARTEARNVRRIGALANQQVRGPEVGVHEHGPRPDQFDRTGIRVDRRPHPVGQRRPETPLNAPGESLENGCGHRVRATVDSNASAVEIGLVGGRAPCTPTSGPQTCWGHRGRRSFGHSAPPVAGPRCGLSLDRVSRGSMSIWPASSTGSSPAPGRMIRGLPAQRGLTTAQLQRCLRRAYLAAGGALTADWRRLRPQSIWLEPAAVARLGRQSRRHGTAPSLFRRPVDGL